MSLNQCQFIGNLGRDPETRSFANSGKVCNLNIAVSESWKDKKPLANVNKKQNGFRLQYLARLQMLPNAYLKKGSNCFYQRKNANPQMAGSKRGR
ncbi:MAG: single-stranded DNA-binding protein [Cypionkella sp.]|nr:single-stranded DNA-binding protein [Cypionkella sp.]